MTTHRDFWHQFDEVPLVIVPTIDPKRPIHSGMVTIKAELIYNPDDPTSDWTIGNITMEGYSQIASKQGKSPWVFVNIPHNIAEILRHRLTNEWHEHVCNSIAEYEEMFQRNEQADIFDYYRDMVKTG